MSKLVAVLVVLLSVVSWAQYPAEYQQNRPGTVKKTTPPTGTATAGQATGGVNVQRKRAGTPEAKMVGATSSETLLTAGTTKELTVNLVNIEPSEVKSIKGFGVCQSVTNLRAIPPSQLKFTVTVPASATNGGCDLALRDVRDKTIYSVYAQIVSQEEARRRAEADRQMQEHQARLDKIRKDSDARMAPYMAQMQANAEAAKKANLGTKWTVNMGNGKRRETWTFVRLDKDGVTRIFTNGTRQIKIALVNGMIMAADETQQCAMQGHMQGNTVSGQMLGNCPEGMMAPWSATIQ